MQRGGKSLGTGFVACPTDACCGQVLEAVVEKGYKGCEFRKVEYVMPEEGKKDLEGRKVRSWCCAQELQCMVFLQISLCGCMPELVHLVLRANLLM